MKNKYFPEDLLIEILSWLPVICLLRFRCVCKSWYVMFQNPKFISKHLKNTKSINDDDDHHHRIIVNRRLNEEQNDCFVSLSYNTLDVICEDLGFQSYDLGYERTPLTFHEILGTFNGVVCLFNYERWEFVFWNPAIRQMKISPKSPFPRPNAFRGVPEYGFGFDFKTNDFKAFSIICLSSFQGQENWTNQIAVYSLSLNSWKLIDAVLPYGLFDFDAFRSRTCANGLNSRLITRHDRETELVTSFLFTFDLSNQVFILTPMPETEVVGYIEHNHRYKILKSFNDSVAYITSPVDPDLHMKSIQVLVLDNYGPNGKWTKLYTIGPLFDIGWPLGFWKNDGLLFDTVKGDLVLCDPTTNELKDLKLDGDAFHLMEYKESLVLLE